MSTELISKINNQKIVVVIDPDGQKFVPIKPICEALGINYTSQLDKLKNEEMLDSVIPLRGTTGTDGKTYQMKCLPIEFVFGWLFSISTKNVKEEAKNGLIEYKKICHKALYNYFTEHSAFVEEKERKINEFVDKEVEARNHFKNAEKLLREIRNERDVFRKTTFEEWKASNNQTKMDL
jgi:hypothetical protein